MCKWNGNHFLANVSDSVYSAVLTNAQLQDKNNRNCQIFFRKCQKGSMNFKVESGNLALQKNYQNKLVPQIRWEKCSIQ